MSLAVRRGMANKRLERWYLGQLRVALKDFPVGELEETESPDFIIGSPERAVGIEVTAFHLPPEEGERQHQETQRLKDLVVARALAIHRNAGGPGLYVSVFFARPLAITKRNAQEISEALALAILATAVPASLEEGAYQVAWGRLPRGINDITIRASVDGQDRLWHADAGGWVAPVAREHIERVVQRKNEMLSTARSKCSDVWLVIVNDEFSRAAPVELSDAAACFSYAHEFNRIFWLDAHNPVVRELNRSAG